MTRTPAAQASGNATLALLDPELAAALQAEIDQTSAENDDLGIALAVSLPNRQRWQGASGLADRNQGLAMAPTTHLRIGSLSKMFLAVVAMQLVETDRLSLDASVASFLPEIVPNAEQMTLRQLMSHTSGLYDYLDNRFIGQVVRDPGRVWASEELIAYAVEQGAYFAPGTPGRWRYSNTNYVLLGMIVEQSSGTSLAQLIREQVLVPLNLQDTFFEPDETPPATLAHGYAGTSDWTNLHMSYARGTASIVSTVGDLERFARALFEGELLEPETLDSMYSFVNANDSFGMEYLEYGLGVMRNPLELGPDSSGQVRPAELRLALGHIGGVSGYRSAIWYLPESGALVVAGFNEASVNPVLLPTRIHDLLLTYQNR